MKKQKPPPPDTNPTVDPSALPALRVAAGRIFSAGRELKNYGATVERICRDAASDYGNSETKTAERAELPALVARMIANAYEVADELPALRRLLPAPAEIDDRERALTRLGLTVRVRYLGPTNTKGGRYVAEVCDDKDQARVFICSQSRNRDECTRLEVAELCLAKWHAGRVLWCKANIDQDYAEAMPHFNARGWDGSAWLFFATFAA